MYLFKSQLQLKSPSVSIEKEITTALLQLQSIFQKPQILRLQVTYHPFQTHLYYLKSTSWAFACLSHITVATRLWEWEWEWEDSAHHPGGITTVEEWEWEADTDAVVTAMVQDSGAADLALVPEVDAEVDAVKGILLSGCYFLHNG
ncbi:hypothetical protein N7486_003135 [Penicillium sp. IBT 16267x]|nr:hypothetical protein N7486_003135 [Penicillium sp. IBT 16267x]